MKSMTRLFVLVLLAGIISFGCGGGGGGSDPDPGPGPESTYVISGTVSINGGGTLAGVTVTLSGASTGTATTDASGNYTLSGLANGSYTISPSLTGYTFSPANKPVTVNGANVTTNNFTATANSSDPITSLLNSLVPIPGGRFMMGSTDNQYGDEQSTTPVHQVTLQAFDIDAYEVTQAQYQAVMGVNPSYFQEGNGYLDTENNPVEQVSWYDARAFCTALSALTGRTFTLPSEAQWEYVCRAGTTTLYSFGDNVALLGDYAWWWYNSDGTTHPVGTKLPNNWGLYDMMGNVWEWCLDSPHSNYIGAPTDGSAWEPETGFLRLLRGGSWAFLSPGLFRSVYRCHYYLPSDRSIDRGFRVVAVPASIIDPHVSSEGGVIGNPISQPGLGFTPGGTAELHFRRPDGSLSPVTTETVGSDGSYNHVWTITSDAMLGTYQYWAVDLSSGKISPEVSYTITEFEIPALCTIDPDREIAHISESS